MATKKKSWTDKLHVATEKKIKRIDVDFADIPANSNMLVATPEIFDAYIKQIPKGTSVTTKTIRKDLAIEHNADYTCPVTTGIFLRIVAEAAYEQYTKQKKLTGITPFWRVIEPGSALAKRLTFGEDFLIEQRKKEKIDH